MIRLRRRLRLRDEGGYSLIEMLTVLVVMGIVMTGLGTLFVQGSNAEIDMNNRFQAQTDGRTALDRFRRDAHTACAETGGTSNVTQTWAVQFTFRTATTTLTSAQATNTGTLAVSSTSMFPSSGTVTVNGLTLTYTGTNASSFTGVTGGTATVQPAGTAVTTTTTCSASASVVTWCTKQTTSSTKYELWRIAGPLNGVGNNCNAGSKPAIKIGSTLTPTSTVPSGGTCNNPAAMCVFTVTGQSLTSLATVHVDLPFSADPRRSVDLYELVDDIVLRNSCRVSGACTT